MKHTISKLLETYENGKLSRRELVQGLALLTASSSKLSAAGFQGNGINHVSLYVSNLQRSTDFYQRVIDSKINKRTGDNQVRLGKQLLVLREGRPAGKVDHIAIGQFQPGNRDGGSQGAGSHSQGEASTRRYRFPYCGPGRVSVADHQLKQYRLTILNAFRIGPK
jgi:catechol 2,3-dioxygenase-like lactoylglutathione lyase family enzyme